MVSEFSWGADKFFLLKLYDSLCRSKLDYGCQIYSSSDLKLRDTDVIHNMGLRVCTGAFKMSPVEILYVDSHELLFDRRREELGLRYTMLLKNSTFKVLRECSSRGFGRSSLKPFQIRQLENIAI